MAVKKFEAVSIAAKKYDSSRYDDVVSKPLPTTKDKVVKTQKLSADGHIETEYEIKKVKVSDAVKNLCWQDFSVDSLIISGAIGNLSFSSLSPDKFSALDGLDGSLDAADAAAAVAAVQSVASSAGNAESENNEVNV